MTRRDGVRADLAIALALMAFGPGASPAAAAPCDTPDNLVPNCGFDVDLSGWTFTGDSAVHVPADGAGAPGCVAVDRHDGVNAIEVFSSCFLVAPSTTYKVALAARVASGPGPDGCFMALVEYSDASCGTYVAEPSQDVTFGPSWRLLLWSRTTAAATHSALLKLACNAAADFVARFDDGEVVPAVFADGFEAGNAGAWSSVVP